MNILLNWIQPNWKFWINFWIEFSGKKYYWINFWIEYSWKKLYWIFLWIESYPEMNEWIIFWIDICNFWWKTPFFGCFGHFLGLFFWTSPDFCRGELNDHFPYWKGRNKAPTLTEHSEIFQYNTSTPTIFTDQLRKEVSPFNKLPCLIFHYGVQKIYLNNHLNLELCLLQPCLKYIVLILIMSDWLSWIHCRHT